MTTKETEFEVRAINADGDATDILCFCDTLAKALEHVPRLHGDIVAYVVEQHTRLYSPRSPMAEDKYKVIVAGGDCAALRAGGWTEEVAS
jgi:hypothetical protein